MRRIITKTKSMKNKGLLHLGLMMLAPTVFYAQQSYTFTSCGATGGNGPTQLQVNNTYTAGNSLNGLVNIGTPGIQQFTVPATGPYKIEARGAKGFNPNGFGGRGAVMIGEFNLNSGDVLKIVVGQAGLIAINTGANAQYGGGGGSFVSMLDNTPLIVAGGGGASWATSYVPTPADGTVSTNGNSGLGSTIANSGAGGVNGAGGAMAGSANGGGGFNTNGAGTYGGQAFISGALGGNPGGTQLNYAQGGFGGGGGSQSFNNARVGGGGGYSGGGGASLGQPNLYGGGGGSYNAGTNQQNTSGGNADDMGLVIISLVALPCTGSMVSPTVGVAITGETSLCMHAGEFVDLVPSAAYLGVNQQWLESSSSSGPFFPVSGGVQGSMGAYQTAAMGPTAVYYILETTCINAGVTVNSNVFAALPIPTIALSAAPFIDFGSSALVVCTNDHYTITASGAVTYDWTNGSTTTNVNPYVLMPAPTSPDYTVTGTSAEGCTDTNTMTIATILESPLLAAISLTNSICKGDNVTLFSSGNVVTYTWSSNANNSSAPVVVVSPLQSQVYVVAGTAVNGCTVSASKLITVHEPAEISAVSSKPNGICTGETAELTALGAVAYTWTSGNGTLRGAEVEVSPEITTNYIIISTDENGCKNSASIQQRVFACVGVNELKNGGLNLNVYPNPNSGAFSIELNNGGLQKTLELFDLTGRKVLSNTTDNDMINLDVSELQNGVYFLNVKSNNTTQTVKIIKH